MKAASSGLPSGSLDPHVEHLRAVIARLRVERLGDVGHRRPAFGIDQRRERDTPQLLTQHRSEDRQQLRFELAFGPGLFHQPHRIDDAVARIGIDLEPLLVLGEHLRAFHVDIENAAVDHPHFLGQRQAQRQPGPGRAVGHVGTELVDDAHRVAGADHHRLMGFGDDHHAGDHRHQQHDADDDEVAGVLEDAVHGLTAPAALAEPRAALPAPGASAPAAADRG